MVVDFVVSNIESVGDKIHVIGERKSDADMKSGSIFVSLFVENSITVLIIV